MPAIALKPEQVIGEFLPTVYISRITLKNNGGYVQSSFQENPHIDPSPSQLAAGIIEGEKTSSGESLSVELALTIKDVPSEAGGSKWFPSGKLSGEASKNYIKINIVQTTTSAETQRWSTLVNSSDIANINVNTLPVGSGTSGKQLSLIDFDNNQIMAQQFIEYNSSGNSFINISKTITCQGGGDLAAPPANPRSLAYFVWSSFDLE